MFQFVASCYSKSPWHFTNELQFASYQHKKKSCLFPLPKFTRFLVNLTVCKSMQIGGNVRLHILDLLHKAILMFINNQHAKNEWLWTNRGQNIIAKMVVDFGETNETKCKFIQFVAIFWLLKLNQPLTNFESVYKKNYLIFWRWRTLHVNIGLTPLVGIWLKTCIGLSLNPLELLCKMLSTLVLDVMKLP
jgi:hypothetical protein